MPGLKFDDDEPKPVKPEKKAKKAIKKPAKTVVNPTFEPVMGHVSIKSVPVTVFTEDEIKSIIKFAHDWQNSHTRAIGKDPVINSNADWYLKAGKIMEKARKFLEGK